MVLRLGAILAMVLTVRTLAVAGDVPPPPCTDPSAATLADRPGTGRTTSAGGAACVVPPGEIVVETGVRQQVTRSAGGSSTLLDGPLTFVRVGIGRNLEVGIAPPTYQTRTIAGMPPFDAALGTSDSVVAAKLLVANTTAAQASLGFAYAPPTGSGEFTAGASTFAFAANLGVPVGARVSIAMSQAAGAAAGPDAFGFNRMFFVYTPSVTLAYALDGVTTLLVQDAFVSRQGPVLPAGSRGFVVVQHAAGDRLAVDVDYEINLASLKGPSHALGLGLVWSVARAR